MKELFSDLFQKRKHPPALLKKILKAKKKLDRMIADAAPEWSIEKINRIDRAILRYAVWEMVIERKNPPKVIIDEAVEIAKTYGAEGSPGFVNGVLGTILKGQGTRPHRQRSVAGAAKDKS